ncbi:hypothetical protein SDC9_52401 [bioreactor metagenome]|uniref:Uncharacterized protein n=1 Tax=bioreactor metagenome TaxID=1076179 RepID=A0A644WQE6_9ZZZZ
MKKGQYSKWIILLVILLNVGFAFGIMWAMRGGASEPVTLTREWFTWTGIELSATAGIKFAKIVAEAIQLLKDGKNDKDSGGENAG